MQGGAAEGTPQHQQILKIVAQSVRILGLSTCGFCILAISSPMHEWDMLQSPKPHSSYKACCH